MTLRLSAVFVVATAALAAQVDWIPRIVAPPPGPAPRFGARMAFDSQRNVTVLFGGADLQLYGDAWWWNGIAWWPLINDVAPPARVDHAMVFDRARGRLVVFGGWNGAPLGDTWEWAAGLWTLVASTGPSPRTGSAMAFDGTRGRTVLFGGWQSGGTAGTFLGDTWEWDGGAWSLVATAGPPPRQGHAMAFDGVRGRTVLFGGYSTGGAYVMYGDTWEWDGVVWSQAATTGPLPREGHALAFDSNLGVVVFGGQGVGAMLCNDTWSWNGSVWQAIVTSAMAPRVAQAMAYDELRQCTVMFGGYTGAAVADVWELASTVAASTPYGAGCGQPPLSLTAVAAAPPVLGGVAAAVIANVPAAFAAMTLGWDRLHYGVHALPFALDGYGLMGCSLLHSAEAFGLVVPVAAGQATFAQPLMNVPALVARHVYLQAYALAPGANPAGVIASNGVDWYLGW